MRVMVSGNQADIAGGSGSPVLRQVIVQELHNIAVPFPAEKAQVLPADFFAKQRMVPIADVVQVKIHVEPRFANRLEGH